MTRRALLVAAALACVQDAYSVSYTTCKDPSVTWYNNKDGLNPCQQYEALRRRCDSGFEVPQLSVNTPGDRCDSQLSACCCNSISFTLSMLCLQCQQGVGTGIPPDTGIDAGTGAYQLYLGSCGPVSNKSLPEQTQLAVCREGPSLKRWMYELFWSDGPWFLEYTRQTANLQAAAGTDDPGKCNDTTSSTIGTTTGTTVSRSTQSEPSSTSAVLGGGTADQANRPGPDADQDNGGGGSKTGIILGATLGAAVAIILLIALSCYLVRRRRRETSPDLYESRPYEGTATMASVVPVPPRMSGSAYTYSDAGAPYYGPPVSAMPPPPTRRDTVPPSYYAASSSISFQPSAPSHSQQASQTWSSPGQSASLLAYQSTHDVLQMPASPPPPPAQVEPYLLMSGGPALNDRKTRPPPAYENS